MKPASNENPLAHELLGRSLHLMVESYRRKDLQIARKAENEMLLGDILRCPATEEERACLLCDC